MINKEKVELMSKVALYEHGEGKTTLKMNKFFKNDYSSARFLTSLPLGIVSALLIILLLFIADADWLIKAFDRLGGILTAVILILAFAAFVIGYSFFATYMFNREYDKYRGNLKNYWLNLKRLNRMYEAREQKEEGSETKE